MDTAAESDMPPQYAPRAENWGAVAFPKSIEFWKDRRIVLLA
jgi:pyridoxine/pyridoxamine 5'-phosphate oxidase